MVKQSRNQLGLLTALVGVVWLFVGACAEAPTPTPERPPTWATSYLGEALGKCNSVRWDRLVEATWDVRGPEALARLAIRDGCSESEFVDIIDRFKVRAVADSLRATITPVPEPELQALNRAQAVLKEAEDALTQISADANYEIGEILYLCASVSGWVEDLQAGREAARRGAELTGASADDLGALEFEEALSLLTSFQAQCRLVGQ